MEPIAEAAGTGELERTGDLGETADSTTTQTIRVLSAGVVEIGDPEAIEGPALTADGPAAKPTNALGSRLPGNV